MANFPAVEEFTMEEDFPTVESFQNADRAVPWREVELNIPYKIIREDIQQTKKGEGMILTLKSSQGIIIRAWATKLIKQHLEANQNRRQVKYILSRGLKTAEQTKNEYYDFKAFIGNCANCILIL